MLQRFCRFRVSEIAVSKLQRQKLVAERFIFNLSIFREPQCFCRFFIYYLFKTSFYLCLFWALPSFLFVFILRVEIFFSFVYFGNRNVFVVSLYIIYSKHLFIYVYFGYCNYYSFVYFGRRNVFVGFALAKLQLFKLQRQKLAAEKFIFQHLFSV